MKTFQQTLREQRIREVLTEARFSERDFNKAVRLLSNVVSRMSGKKLYQFGGTDYLVSFNKAKTGKGIGALFLMDDGGALRINYERTRRGGGSITSVDLWNKWKIEGVSPNYTMPNLQNLNVVQLSKAVSSFVKSPSTSVKLPITEAVDLKAIAIAAHKEYGTTELKVSELKSFAQRLGKKINQYQTLKLPKKERGIVDLSVLMEVESGEEESVILGKDEKRIQAAADRVPVDVLFQDLADLVDLVIKGVNPSLVITGSGGTGKTHTVKERLKAAGLRKGIDYEIKKGATSTFGLYQDFFMARRGKLLIFDDNDDVFKDMTSQNLLKAALDSYDEREISWTSKNTLPVDRSMSKEGIRDMERAIEQDILAGEEKVKLPNTFEFEGRVIFISNLPPNKIPQPVISRSTTIDVTLTDDEMLARMKGVIPFVSSETGVSEDEANSVLTKLQEMADAGQIAKPTMRTLPAAIKIYKSGAPRWEQLLKYAAANN